MIIMKLMSLLYYFFTSKKIILVSTPLQLLNVLELESKQLNEKISANKFVFVTNSSKVDLIKIRETIKFFNFKHCHIYNANFFLTKFILLILLEIKKIIKYKISFLIIGNYANKFFLRFAYTYEKVFIVDDGTNFFDQNNKKIIKKNNVFFFTFLNKKIFKNYKFKNIIVNNFLLTKSELFRIKKKIFATKRNIIILGNPHVEGELISLSRYIQYLDNLKIQYKSNKIYY